MSEIVVPISSVLKRIKNILEQTMTMDSVWIRGEISNLTKHRSGHYYFSIKDEGGALSCVMWASYVQKLSFDLEEGMQVLIKADVSVYEQRGSLQLYVKAIRPDGIGALYLAYEQRKKMFEEKGYFLASNKKPKPSTIQKIAIITAKEGAALQDALTTIQKRWPMLEIFVYPALVQGNQAAKTIVQQLEVADKQNYDAILLIRGGGSFEDLFCFNDESLIESIYKAKTYIVSGVGHETDTTLCDLVSDHRAVTPTAAAQWVTLDQKEVLENIHRDQTLMYQYMQQFINRKHMQLNQYAQHPYLQNPLKWIEKKQYALQHFNMQLMNLQQDMMHLESDISYKQTQIQSAWNNYMQTQKSQSQRVQENLMQSMQQYLNHQRLNLTNQISLLDAYSPLKTLARGYSVTYQDQQVIHSVDDVQIGDEIRTKVSDGLLYAKVTNKE